MKARVRGAGSQESFEMFSPNNPVGGATQQARDAKNLDKLTGAADKLYLDSAANTATALKSLRAKYSDAFDDGARCGFLDKFPGNREPGGYPKGIHDWPLERRNAWFAGFNQGYCDRLHAAKVGGAHNG